MAIRFLASLFIGFMAFAAHASPDLCSEAFRRTSATPQHLSQLNADIRVRVLCEIKDALANKYSLLELKKERLNFDGLKRMDSCIAREQALADFSLVNFEDRALECMAAFRDTHLITESLISRPHVVSGVLLKKINNQIVVAGYDAKVIDLSHSAFKSILRPGTVVEKIDGSSPLSQIQTLSRYINGSSKEYVETQAVRALTVRNFFYPTQSHLTLHLKGHAQPITLPWHVFPLVTREDLVQSLLVRLNMKILLPLGFRIERPVDGVGADFVGYDEALPFRPGTFTEYFTRKPVVSIRTGRITVGSETVCYLQLMDSTTKKVRLSTSPARELDRHTVLGEFIRQCEADRKGLLLDLRDNSGGDIDVPVADSSLLTPAQTVLPSHFTSGRLTSHLRKFFEVYNLGPQAPIKDWDAFSADRNYRALQEALQSGFTHLSAIPEQNIKPSGKVGGFNGRIVVALSSKCFSSCEIMAGILEHRPNTVITGTAANGSGGRFHRYQTLIVSPGYRDEVFDTLAVRIPNTLFGVNREPVSSGHLLPFDQIKDLIRENKPLEPTAGFAHKLTLRDLSEHNSDWLHVIEKGFRQ